MLLFFGLVVGLLVVAGLVRFLRLPVEWTGYAALALLIVGAYVSFVADAHEHPWGLWRRNWEQDSGDAEQRSLGRYKTRDECLSAQWKKLEEEVEQQAQVNEAMKSFRQAIGQQRVYLREGRTIFELGPSMLSRLMEYSAKKRGLTEDQKSEPAFDLLTLPEIKATVSVFCAPSVKYRLFPFYTPSYRAATDDLRALGERALRVRAKEALGK